MEKFSRRKLVGLGGIALIGALTPLTIGAAARQTEDKFGLPFGGSPSLAGWSVRQWYGNTRWAYRQRRAIYSAGQGIHFGVDLAAPCGFTVAAIGAGTV